MRAIELGMTSWLSVLLLVARAIRRRGEGDPTTSPSASSWRDRSVAVPPGPWAASAACRDADTALFFASDELSMAIARRLCRRCPVRAECQAYALAFHDVTGVWGGLTEAERRRNGLRPRAEAT
jgi:WhiB family transcriptional regulator, redox-sensing transcriptional regulator